MREGACMCIHGCAKLTGVQEGACECIPGCAELTGMREGACMCIRGLHPPARAMALYTQSAPARPSPAHPRVPPLPTTHTPLRCPLPARPSAARCLRAHAGYSSVHACYCDVLNAQTPLLLPPLVNPPLQPQCTHHTPMPQP